MKDSATSTFKKTDVLREIYYFFHKKLCKNLGQKELQFTSLIAYPKQSNVLVQSLQ
jgi:hypothetical protein